MIPKKIHYCWFGKHALPALNQACVDTWNKHLSDYELILWDESNCPQNAFVEYHLAEGNWAFVSDYVRLYALYTEGGIYIDTDFEVLKSFDDLLDDRGFLAFQDQVYITNGIAGSIEGNIFFKDCMEYMIKRFEENQEYHISPLVATNVLKSNNYDIKVYESEYFYPYNPYDPSREIKKMMYSMVTEKTYAIHHWAKSWELEQMPEVQSGTGLCILLKKILNRIGIFR